MTCKLEHSPSFYCRETFQDLRGIISNDKKQHCEIMNTIHRRNINLLKIRQIEICWANHIESWKIQLSRIKRRLEWTRRSCDRNHTRWHM